MSKRIETIDAIDNLQVVIKTLGTATYGESVVVIFKNKMTGIHLFTFLVDSISGEHDYIKKLKDRNKFDILTCVCWTHPHIDHTEDIYKILSDGDLVKLNKRLCMKYDDSTRLLMPWHLNNSLSTYNMYYPCKIKEDVDKILKNKGYIGVRTSGFKNTHTHTWYIKIEKSNIKIPITLRFLSPTEKIGTILSKNVRNSAFNYFSLSFVLEIGNYYSIFLGGDMINYVIKEVLGESKTDDDFIVKLKQTNRDLIAKCGIIKVPHHGSKNSIDILKYVSQETDYAIMTSDSRHRLPKEEVISKYAKRLGDKNKVLQTQTLVSKENDIGIINVLIDFDVEGNVNVSYDTECYSKKIN